MSFDPFSSLPPLPQNLPRPPLPLFALRPLFAHLITTLVSRHPHLFDRLDTYGSRRFLIDPVDLPFTLLLAPDAEAPKLTPHDRDDIPPHDASISGPLAKLVELVSGVVDGDALFFSRELQIGGDTEAVLALRNAIDDTDIDLVAEIEDMLGPLAPVARWGRARIESSGGLVRGLKLVLSETFIRRTIDRTQGGAGRS